MLFTFRKEAHQSYSYYHAAPVNNKNMITNQTDRDNQPGLD